MESEGHKCTSIQGGMDHTARDRVIREFRCRVWGLTWGEGSQDGTHSPPCYGGGQGLSCKVGSHEG